MESKMIYGLFLLVGSIVIPFLPTIVALTRRHHNTMAIVVLNLIAIVMLIVAVVEALGSHGNVFAIMQTEHQAQFALAFWSAAMVWACTAVTQKEISASAIVLAPEVLAPEKKQKHSTSMDKFANVITASALAIFAIATFVMIIVT
jgi:hypothetical protein